MFLCITNGFTVAKRLILPAVFEWLSTSPENFKCIKKNNLRWSLFHVGLTLVSGWPEGV